MISPLEVFVRKIDELHQGLRNAKSLFDVMRLGGVLRQLFLDERPLIHQANKTFRLDLRFVLNDVGSISDVPVTPAILIHSKALDPEFIRARAGTKSLKLSQFLAQRVIETPNLTISVRDIIKFAANKYGGIHLDDRRSEDEQEKDEVFNQIRSIGLEPVAELLRVIARLSLRGLRPLREKIVKVPPGISLVAYYRLPNPGDSLRFSGKGQFLETNDMKVQLKTGFSWNGLIAIAECRRNGSHFIYEVGNFGNSGPRISLFIDRLGSLVVEAKLDKSTELRTKALGFCTSPFFGKYSLISFQLGLNEGKAELQLLIDEKVVDGDDQSFSGSLPALNRQTIGSNLVGEKTASFNIAELVISDHFLANDEIRELSRYIRFNLAAYTRCI